MKICEVTPYRLSQISGVTSVVLDLARGFRSLGHDVVVLSPGDEGAAIGEGVASWTIQVQGRHAGLAFTLGALRTLLRHRRAWTVIHVHQGHPAILGAALLGRYLSRPVVATLHVRPPQAAGIRGVVDRTTRRLLLRTCSALVFVSEHTRRDFGSRGWVIRNGIDVERVKSALGNRTSIRAEFGLDGFVIAYMGRRAKIKGYWDLLEAVRRGRHTGLDLRILTTGDVAKGEEDELARRIESLGLAEAIADLGLRDDRLSLLAAADAFALPSYREGFPMALLEAMAAGLPVVASDVGGIPEMVQDGEEGFLVRPGDIATLEDRLRRLANDRSLHAAMAFRAQEKVVQFSTEAMTEAYLSVFRKVAAENPPRGPP